MHVAFVAIHQYEVTVLVHILFQRFLENIRLLASLPNYLVQYHQFYDLLVLEQCGRGVPVLSTSTVRTYR